MSSNSPITLALSYWNSALENMNVQEASTFIDSEISKLTRNGTYPASTKFVQATSIHLNQMVHIQVSVAPADAMALMTEWLGDEELAYGELLAIDPALVD